MKAAANAEDDNSDKLAEMLQSNEAVATGQMHNPCMPLPLLPPGGQSLAPTVGLTAASASDAALPMIDSRPVIVGTHLLGYGSSSANAAKRKSGQRGQDEEGKKRKKRLCKLCHGYGSPSHQVQCKKSNPMVWEKLCLYFNEDGSTKPRDRS